MTGQNGVVTHSHMHCVNINAFDRLIVLEWALGGDSWCREPIWLWHDCGGFPLGKSTFGNFTISCSPDDMIKNQAYWALAWILWRGWSHRIGRPPASVLDAKSQEPIWLSRIFESSSNLLICCWCWQRTITSASSICLDVLKGSAWSKRVPEDGGKRRKPNGLSCHIRVLLFIRTGAKIYSYPPPPVIL